MRGVVFASFGTTHQAARERQIDGVARFLQQCLPDCTVTQAYTSDMVRGALLKRGIEVPDVVTALQGLARQGIADVTVQPGHLLPGEEYRKLRRQAGECKELFDRLRIGAPLLTSTEDLHRMAEILAEQYPPLPGRGVVMMGHGTNQPANTAYAALQYHLRDIGRDDIYIGVVEGYPCLQTILKLVGEKQYAGFVLAPLMLVAGDHAANDMAGEGEGSWASALQAAGYEVECRMEGLGGLPDVRRMYMEHLCRAGECL